jgi:hypothetical protein
VAGLLAIVALSYQQTVHAYPSGGGSYIVSTANLGRKTGMLAASSLMIDYVMTVAVSVAAGVAAVISAFPSLLPYRVEVSAVIVVLMALANLRGLRESGRIFALPTYSFIVLCGGLVVVGTVRWLMGDLHPVVSGPQAAVQGGLTLYLVLRAFSGGCSAMTGTEAFPMEYRPSSPQRAAMLHQPGNHIVILGTFLLGVTHLSRVLELVPRSTAPRPSSDGRSSRLRDGAFLYFALQIATMAILFMGANTSSPTSRGCRRS